jgi:exonuclease III
MVNKGAPIRNTSLNGATIKENDIKSFNIFHQNIRGLRGKANERLSHLHPAFPHILHLTEHHMNLMELQLLNIDSYKLGANYCRTMYEKGGVCIYLHTNLNFVNIDLNKYCKDKDFEVCTVKLNLSSNRLCIITIHRAPTGNIDTFITKLDTILRNLYTPTQEYIICGDININYLPDSEKKRKLDTLLRTYNLISMVNFPTRVQGNSAIAIDNIFIDITRRDNYSIRPILNGLSDHDAQSITFNTINARIHAKKFKIIREINTQ